MANKIKHSTVEKIEDFFEENLSLYHCFVGSYRRGLPYVNDIDVVVITENGKTFFEEWKDILNLHSPTGSGKSRLSCLITFEGDDYKIDFFFTNALEWPFAIFYATGSKTFNIIMRRKAKSLGYLLNQRGLYVDGERIPDIISERDIMKHLGYDYLEPEERTDHPKL